MTVGAPFRSLAALAAYISLELDWTRTGAGQFAPFGGFLAECQKLLKNQKKSVTKNGTLKIASVFLKGRFFRGHLLNTSEKKRMASAFEAGAYAIR